MWTQILCQFDICHLKNKLISHLASGSRIIQILLNMLNIEKKILCFFKNAMIWPFSPIWHIFVVEIPYIFYIGSMWFILKVECLNALMIISLVALVNETLFSFWHPLTHNLLFTFSWSLINRYNHLKKVLKFWERGVWSFIKVAASIRECSSAAHLYLFCSIYLTHSMVEHLNCNSLSYTLLFKPILPPVCAGYA
jgi:hypothetical protein